MRSFCIVTNKKKDPNLEFTGIVRDTLESKGCLVTDDINGQYDCMIVLGGDGTIIEAARSVEDPAKEITIVGINLGHLGFLSSVEKNEVYAALNALIEEDFITETRMMIEACVSRPEQSVSDFKYIALNDVVINRMGYTRMITTHINVNESLVNSYFGDGVIIATPTGSTGYNLSAGGPIVTPEAELMVITPICPHSLSMRSVVVAASDEIEVSLDMSRETEPDNAILAIDGQRAVELYHGDRVCIRRSARKVKLVRFKDKSFFKLLYMKLGEQS